MCGQYVYLNGAGGKAQKRRDDKSQIAARQQADKGDANLRIHVIPSFPTVFNNQSHPFPYNRQLLDKVSQTT